jgi:uncharacterized damage-inducible protein DinB
MDNNSITVQLLQLFYTYNFWATSQLIEVLKGLSEEEISTPGCSGHGSIRKTMAHLFTTQWGWFSWFDKSRSAQEAMTLRITPEEIDTPDKLQHKWQEIKKQTNDCLEKLTPQDLMENWTASTAGGFTMTLPLWKLLMHVANHGTHTRAQIVAAIRRLGHDPGSYEFFRYALSQQQSG